MPGANRHHISRQVWHITHRCHKKEFLLKLARDSRRWQAWLFEAKKRFGLKILNYVVTSNHIHLLVVDDGPNVLPKSLQPIAGRTTQEFNPRKKRKGAFREDRYHATEIEQNEHLFRCLVYLDLNMVRAGAVNHPSEWELCGYNEIQNPPERYGAIDLPSLRNLCGFSDPERFVRQHRQWAQEAISNGINQRDSCWTQSIAVGGLGFVAEIKTRLGRKGMRRKIEGQEHDRCVLREDSEPYGASFDPEIEHLSSASSYFWDNLYAESIG